MQLLMGEAVPATSSDLFALCFFFFFDPAKLSERRCPHIYGWKHKKIPYMNNLSCWIAAMEQDKLFRPGPFFHDIKTSVRLLKSSSIAAPQRAGMTEATAAAMHCVA